MTSNPLYALAHAVSFTEKIQALQKLSDGVLKERHLMRLFLKAGKSSEFWEIYWTTADPELQDDALVAIFRYPESPRDIAKAIELASESVRRYIDIHSELRTASILAANDTTNRERLIIARSTHDPMIQKYALECILTHTPNGSELLEIIQDTMFPQKFRRAAESLFVSEYIVL